MIDDVEREFRNFGLQGKYHHGSDEPDDLEYVVAVDWIDTVPLDECVWETGMFVNQNSASKLRNRFTLERLSSKFQVNQ